MTGWTIHLELRDDQTAEDAYVLADQLAGILRYATGGFHITESDDWRVCRVKDWDADHTCAGDPALEDPWHGVPDGWAPAPGDEDDDDPGLAAFTCECGDPLQGGVHTATACNPTPLPW